MDLAHFQRMSTQISPIKIVELINDRKKVLMMFVFKYFIDTLLILKYLSLLRMYCKDKEYHKTISIFTHFLLLLSKT